MANNMTEAQKRELQDFIEVERTKDVMHSAALGIADKCYDKCVKEPSNSLTSTESTCMKNCVERFMDTSVLLFRLAEMRAQGGH